MKRGFTIVELLIVVVVIGILAAVTIVAYNGITTRAQNSATLTMLKDATDALEAYHAANHHYPTIAADPMDDETGYGYACLGNGFPDDTCGGAEWKCGDDVLSGSPIKSSEYFNNEMQGFLKTTLPALITPTLDQIVSEGGGCTISLKMSGATYGSACSVGSDGLIALSANCSNDHAYFIYYALKGADDCGIQGAVDQSATEGWKQCMVYGDDENGTWST